jgi:hypothetical protein
MSSFGGRYKFGGVAGPVTQEGDGKDNVGGRKSRSEVKLSDRFPDLKVGKVGFAD